MGSGQKTNGASLNVESAAVQAREGIMEMNELPLRMVPATLSSMQQEIKDWALKDITTAAVLSLQKREGFNDLYAMTLLALAQIRRSDILQRELVEEFKTAPISRF